MGAQAVRLSNLDIDNALKNKDFEVLFQPIFDLNNGALARMETFVRWKHAALGTLPPGAFISFFESQGRMGELTRYVLNEALTRYLAWRGPFDPGFSINLALSDLSDEAFSSHLSVLLREHKFPPNLVTLECPMPPVDQNIDRALENYERLSQTGARLAIEVRGRTNDFLNKIDPFPFAEIKTGGAAILRFARTVRGPGLSAISELLELANSADAAITAVGVEDQASLSALRSLGFSAAQGNHLGKVGSITDFTPSNVNDVRGLLGLDPLDRNNIDAMFRTSAPKSNAKEVTSKVTTKDQFPAHEAGDLVAEDDDLLDRLAARIAANETAPEKTEPKPASTREASLKAAAIAKAKSNSPRKSAIDQNQARKLQSKLLQEFPHSSEETSQASEEASPATKKIPTPVKSTSASAEDLNTPKESTTLAPEPIEEKAKTKVSSAQKPSQKKKPSKKVSPTPKDSPADKIEKAARSEDIAPTAAASTKSINAAPFNPTLNVGAATAFFRPVIYISNQQSVVEEVPEVNTALPEITIVDPATFSQKRQNDVADQAEKVEEASEQDEHDVVGGAENAVPDSKQQAEENDDTELDNPESESFLAEDHEEEFESDIEDELNEEIEEDEEAEWAEASAELAEDEYEEEENEEPEPHFLLKKYPYPKWPNHFWPRSWKRAWIRREEFRAELRAEKEAADSLE